MKQTAVPKARYLPPLVSYEIGPAGSSGARGWVVGLWCAGVVAVARLLVLQPQFWPLGLGALAVGSWAALLELRSVAGQRLEWRKPGWHLLLNQPGAAVADLLCEPRVVIDFQRMILLRVTDEQRMIHWVWLVRRDTTQWHRLRCALFARRQP